MYLDEYAVESNEGIKKTRDRLDYIDAAKGIGILLVVIGHHLMGAPAVTAWIMSFHMPLFFLISGYLIYKDKKIDVKTKVAKLLYPYITFSCLQLTWYLSYNVMLVKKQDEPVLSVVLKMILGYGYLALWFLPALALAWIVFSNLINKKGRCVYFLTEVIAGIILLHLSQNTETAIRYVYIFLGRSLIACSFMYIGFIIRNYLDEKLEKLVLPIVVMGGVSLLISRVNPVNLAVGKISDPFLYYIAAIAGSVSVISLCKHSKLRRNRFLNYLGKNSIIVMALHMQAPVEIAWIILGIMKVTRIGSIVIQSILAIIIELIILLAMIRVIQRWFRWILIPPKREENNE